MRRLTNLPGAASVSRRLFLLQSAAFALLARLGFSTPALAQAATKAGELGPPEPFDFDRLTQRARDMSRAQYMPFAVRAAELLERIDYDFHWKIRFKPEHALWGNGKGPFPVRMFHPSRWQKEAVVMHLVEGGKSRQVIFSSDYFDTPPDHAVTPLYNALPKDLGFSGFRVMHPKGHGDWLAFLGVSYFRSAGELDQYGQSARGIAIDTAMPKPEEFPRFSHFWLEANPKDRGSFNIYALLDGPSVTGAYRFTVSKKKAVLMDVRAKIFARKDVARMGVAPLTSMYWYAEHNRHQAIEWRPEIHDSDGLAIWTGTGERIWRPINNPPHVMANSFLDKNPKGFGLLQRDRDFGHYEDPAGNYHKRPSVWVEPLGEWGEGVVQLVEIPTNDEIHDNIVAYWIPKEPVRALSEWTFDYRLHWVDQEPYPPKVARVVQTMTGLGGVAGQPRPKGQTKFVVDFDGGPLKTLHEQSAVKAEVSANRGKVVGDVVAFRVPASGRWRAAFDIQADGADPVDLRCFLKLGDQTLTETWLYQHFANDRPRPDGKA